MVTQAPSPLVALLLCPPSFAPPWPWRRPCSSGLSLTGFSPGSTWPCLCMHWRRCELKLKFEPHRCESPTLLKPEFGCSSVRQCMSAALDVEVKHFVERSLVQASSLVEAWTQVGI